MNTATIENFNKLKIVGWYEMQLRDKYGNIKPLWQENSVMRFLKRTFGIMPKIPFVTGNYSDKMVTVKNLITNAGFAGLASRINGDGSEAAFTYLAVGTGTTAAAVTDTTLQTELGAGVGLARASATASRVTTTVTNDTAQLAYTWTVSGAGAAITEAGVLNAASVGTLLSHQVYAAVNAAAGDTYTLTYKVKAS